MPVASFRCILLFALCFVATGWSRGQLRYAVDTSFEENAGCKRKFLSYFSIRAKYPESAEYLRHKAEAVVSASGTDTALNGFISFQFIVDCNGHTSAYQLSQTDRNYQPKEFPVSFVNALYAFVKGLQQWKHGIYEGEQVYYKAYVAFKIKNGHVAEVSP